MNYVEINNKKYRLENRTSSENTEFCALLTSAVDKLEQAASNITYIGYTNLNNEIIDTLNEVITTLSNMEEDVSSEQIHIEKLVLMTSPVHYYELQYFHNRRDSGAIYIETDLDVYKFMTEDAFLLQLVEQKKLSASKIDNITKVTEINKIVYEKMKKKFIYNTEINQSVYIRN